ncbi:hypothetical protein ASPZODRAFT_125698 [Penicilliopsis zonata CBS 506.65]|uniref:GED domain-containing protein n=1 Tax=Penicilliopsis zonata CBS 506.65 TaxID=1073090 RepID=A0A1L9S5C1_9EURO|nr:hypothetical protein ASPZODRAFT_125698 [Penicilliopsis zonata CBS 506.65]OJJ42340.1 hypothetical protein ASPZODRAFT_125698 [Penicilliopsis zonata CBS 506.65]
MSRSFVFGQQAAAVPPFDFAVPSVEENNNTNTHNAGSRTSSNSTPLTPDRNTVSSVTGRLQGFNMQSGSPRTPRAANIGLSPGQLTSTFGHLFNATPEPARDTSENTESYNSDDGGSNDSNSEGEGEEEEEEVYSLRDEQLPPARVYNNELQTVLGQVKAGLAGLHQDMEGSSLSHEDDSTLSALKEDALRLSKFDFPVTRTVGFIGDSGAGKSAVINSVMDIKGLVQSSNQGSACTSVVTELRHTDDSHPPYTVEVDYMDSDAIKELLEELVQSFRMYHTDNVFREVESVHEQQRVREQATRAWSTLTSLFRGHDELTHEFLAEQGEGAYRRILDQLCRWTEASFTSRPGGEASRYCVVTGNLEACRRQVEILTRDPEDGVAWWPFINIIRLYIRSPVLRNGLILADLPGFRDLNYARVRATERYLKHTCNEVFIVTQIARCLTDPSIPEIKKRCDPDQPLRIVCTRSEEVNADEAPTDYPHLAGQIRRLHSTVEDLERRIRRLRQRRRQGRARNGEDGERLRDELETAKFNLESFLIQTRNQKITSQLTAGNEIRVFCVSNTMYRDRRNEEPPMAEKYIGLSGIRELRRYCQLVPADAQFRAVEAFLKGPAPAFVRSVQQWTLTDADSITVERANSLRRVLGEVETVLCGRLASDSDLRTLPRRLTRQFNAVLTANNRRNAWKESALAASREWAGWHWSSYAAFCRNYGTWDTKAVGSRCWNNEVLEGIRGDLEQPWNSTLDWALQQKEHVASIIEEIFQSASEILADNTNLAPIALENFIDNMDFWEQSLTDSLDRGLEELFHASTRIQRDTLWGHDSSYIAGLMRPVYIQCSQDSGTGSYARRKAYMDAHLRHGNIFPQLLGIVESSNRELFRAYQTQLKRVVEAELGNILRDLRGIVPEEGELSEAARFPDLAKKLEEQTDSARQTLDRAEAILSRLCLSD